jgi:hypothetical protein
MVIVGDNILCLHFSDLSPKWFTEDYLKKKLKESRQGVIEGYKSLPDPEDGRKALIIYSTIPAKAIAERGIPSEEYFRQEYRKQQIAQRVPFNDHAYNYFLKNPLTMTYARELAEQASWLLFLAQNKSELSTLLGVKSVDEVYTQAMRLMCEKEWRTWECTSLQVFRRKLKPFQKVKRVSVLGTDAENSSLIDALKKLEQNKILSKLNNSNRAKLGIEQEALLVQIHGNSNKPPIEQTYMLYLRRATEQIKAGKWPETAIVSLTTVRNFLNKTEQVWYGNRHGVQEWRDKFEIVTHRKKASMANALWISDNTRIHRTYANPKGKGGISHATFTIVLDAHSWCILGFFISDTENTLSMMNTYRNACELSGYVPYQVQTDNGPAYSSAQGKASLNALAKYVTPTEVGNARAKKIESFFHQFNSLVLRYRKGFTSSPTTFSLEHRPNREHLAALVKSKQLPLIDDVIKEMYEDITLWNHHKIKKYDKTPLELYFASVESTKDMQRRYTPEVERAAFYVRSQYLYRKEGFVIRQNKKDHIYRVEDPFFNAHYIDHELTVEYDPRDLNKGLWLYLDNKPVMLNNEHVVALPARLYHESLLDHTADEGKALSEHRSRKKEQRQISNKRFVDYLGITKSNGTFTEMITENAFDKETLRLAQQQRLEQMTNGEYRLTEPEETVEVPVKKNDQRIRREDL